MKRMIAAALAAVAFAATCLGAPSLARAEVGDVSTVQLDVEPDGVDATLDLPLVAVEAALGTSATDDVAAYLASHVQVAYSSDGRPWAASPPLLSFEPSDVSPAVSARIHFTRPEGLHENALELTDDAIVEREPRHRVVVFVRRDFEMAKLDDEATLAGTLHASRKTLTLLRADASWGRGMRALFGIGVDRLVVGPGLLLLWLVLLAAPLLAMHGRWSGVRTTRGAVHALAIVVTTYVVTHATAFALGSLGWLSLPPPVLELLVALSLAVIAFHTLRPLGRIPGAWIAGAAGVVHGLAFAATLADLGPCESVASLVTFTVGIEGLQLILVMLVSPSLIFLRDTRMYGVLRVGAASAAAIAALVTVAPTPVVMLVAMAALAVAWLAAATIGQRVFHSASAR
jgi:hypothetical protein